MIALTSGAISLEIFSHEIDKFGRLTSQEFTRMLAYGDIVAPEIRDSDRETLVVYH